MRYTPPPVEIPEPTKQEVLLERISKATEQFIALRRAEEARLHPPVHRSILKDVQRDIQHLVASGRVKSRVVDIVARKYQLSLEQVETELDNMAQDAVLSRAERLNNTDYHEILASDGLRQLQLIRDGEFKAWQERPREDDLEGVKERKERRRGEAADRVARTNGAIMDVLGRVNRRFSSKTEQVSIVAGGDKRAQMLAEILTGQRQQEGGEDFDALDVADVVPDATGATGADGE